MPLNLIRLRLFMLLCCAALLMGCAQDRPAFVPPAERPVGQVDQPWPTNHLLTLAYHDVEDDDPNQQFLSVQTDQLIAHLQWLRDNGYQAVSIDQILAAHDGGKPLPPKAVLLSFDDGYSSFYTRVYPILKAFDWPAVWAPVGQWVGTAPGETVDFGGLQEPRGRFATWSQVREVARSGLVEIASHTQDQHKGIPANPQGNTEPAEATHRYDRAVHRYESDATYSKRIREDTRRISDNIRRATGQSPRVWVWPYGAAHGQAIDIITAQGYRMALTLDDGLGTVQRLMSEPRMLVNNSPDMGTFARSVLSTEARASRRVVQVDLDYVYDADPVQMEKNLDALVQRVSDLGINTVFLQAFADPQGDGLIKSVYFPNHYLPMRADLFNRALWQLRTRTFAQVFAWMPVLSFDLDPSIARVSRWDPDHPDAAPRVDRGQYVRLSPFDPKARAAIVGLYEDLARSAPIDGILFHDDALLSDFEDASPPALAAYHEAGLPDSVQALRADPASLQRWTRFKSLALINFTRLLADHVRAIRGPQVQTARNLYAVPILNPASETWFAQNPGDFLKAYDWTVPMTMPLMEGVAAGQTLAWIDRIVNAMKQYPGGLEHTIFELQSRDWRTTPDSDVDSRTLASWMEHLQLAGVRNFGYYPDDFLRNQPRLDIIRPMLSNAWYPYHD